MKHLFLRNRLCVPIKGYNRSVIIDLIRTDFYFIPNSLFEIIESDDIIDFNQRNIKDLNQWIQFLIDEEIIFEIKNSNELKLFPSLSYEYHSPHLLSCIIIHSNFNMDLFHFFSNMRIQNISIIFDKFKSEEINFFLKLLSKKEVDSINIYIKKEEKLTLSYLQKIAFPVQPLNIYVFCNNNYKNEKVKQGLNVANVHFMAQTFNSFTSTMQPIKITVNSEHFFESYNRDNYFNQKLYIDNEGKIKNGLNNSHNFGNINKLLKNDFLEIINSKQFQYLWNKKKENTLVCKECEFRFMCVDPREPKMNEKGEWFHENECTYNPYISKWDNEGGFKSLTECGVKITRKGVFSIDTEKANEIFETEW